MRLNQAIPAGIISHPWSEYEKPGGAGGNGSVIVDADNCAGVPDRAGNAQPCFGVTFYDVPQDACIQLVTQVSQKGLGLELINVNNVLTGSAVGGISPLPVPASTAKLNCNNGNPFGMNDIIWEYSVRSGGS
jgi:hypothetical protein